jgi:hypothetical protein
VNPKRYVFLVATALATAVALWPADASAQRRVVRRGPGTRVAVAIGYGYGYPVYGYPVFGYPYFYDPFYWGFSDYQFRYPYPGYYYPAAEVRIQVQPKQAEVYIDGYLVGTVDNFDGVFQRLDVPLGEHEITVYAPGYRTWSQRMLFRPRQSYHIKEALQPLPAGEQPEARPAPAPRAQGPGPQGPPPPGPPPRGGDRRGPDRDLRVDQFGTLSVRVQPADAEITIDGERWEAPGGERIVVQLTEGTHRIDVRKDGFRTYTSTVRVRAGETTTLNVSLSAGG